MATYAIGDVQGCFDELQALLERIGFNPSMIGSGSSAISSTAGRSHWKSCALSGNSAIAR
jgi:hypothetical protein